MPTAQTLHPEHTHTHDAGCGHVGIRHEDHVDYLHDGHLHHQDESGRYVEHVLPVNDMNPATCTPNHSCGGHSDAHQHGPGCGHEVVPHGDHTDYLVDGHLHHPHRDHCDDHGAIAMA